METKVVCDKIESDLDHHKIQRAAALVGDAVDGVYVSTAKNRSESWSSLWHNLSPVRTITAIGIVLISLFEQPVWCFGDDLPCGN